MVYFVICLCGCRRVKIGTADDVSKRMMSLKGSSAHPVSLLGEIPGSYLLEQWLHACFRKWWLHHEWYDSRVLDDVHKILRTKNVDEIIEILKKSKHTPATLPPAPGASK